MRKSDDLVEIYQKYFPEEFEFFENRLRNGYKKDGNDCRFFLGARDNYLNIYYMGQSIAKIEIPYKGDSRRKTNYSVAKYIYYGDLEGEDANTEDKEKKQSYVPLEWEEYKDAFDAIIDNARKHASGKRKGAKQKTVHREKICQQNIINYNNADQKSDWYYIDMEYIDAQDPCGRVDMVAIRKSKNNNGKQEVALVELKVGTDAYGCSIANYGELKERIYDKLEKNLYISEFRKYKYGSGILSHIADYLRYLNDDRYKKQLRKELVLMLKVHNAFGVLQGDNLSLATLTEDDFEDKPTIYILSYTHDPLVSEKKKNVNELKRTMYKYLFKDKPMGTSDRALEKMLDPIQVRGFIDKKMDFQKFLESEEIELDCIQNVNGNDYTFKFKFWDPDKHPNRAWDCLG